MPQVPVRIGSGTPTSYGGQAAALVVATTSPGLLFATRTLMAFFTASSIDGAETPCLT